MHNAAWSIGWNNRAQQSYMEALCIDKSSNDYQVCRVQRSIAEQEVVGTGQEAASSSN